jgi:hypothetical protein
LVGRTWGEGRLEEYRTIEQGISNDEVFRRERHYLIQSFLRMRENNVQQSMFNAQCSGKGKELRFKGLSDESCPNIPERSQTCPFVPKRAISFPNVPKHAQKGK